MYFQNTGRTIFNVVILRAGILLTIIIVEVVQARRSSRVKTPNLKLNYNLSVMLSWPLPTLSSEYHTYSNTRRCEDKSFFRRRVALATTRCLSILPLSCCRHVVVTHFSFFKSKTAKHAFNVF